MRVCSQCDGNRIFRKLVQTRGEGFDLLPGVGRWWYGASIWVYVCGGCGHTEFRVPSEHLAKIRKKFDPV